MFAGDRAGQGFFRVAQLGLRFGQRGGDSADPFTGGFGPLRTAGAHQAAAGGAEAVGRL
jgi:hypothetical protein